MPSEEGFDSRRVRGKTEWKIGLITRRAINGAGEGLGITACQPKTAHSRKKLNIKKENNREKNRA